MSQPSGDAKIEGFSIPADRNDLAEILNFRKRKKISLYNLRGQWFGSGSKVSEKKFAAFRAIWPRLRSHKQLFLRDSHIYGIDKFWKDAENIANNFSDLDKFLDMVETDTRLKGLDVGDERYPSILATLRDLHELIGFDAPQTRQSRRMKRAAPDTQSRPSSSSRAIKKFKDAHNLLASRTSEETTERPSMEQDTPSPVPDVDFEAPDEATVNAATVVFLRDFSSLVKDCSFEFVFERVVFTPTFGTCSFMTHTDGAFRNRQIILAIIEVKKVLRCHDLKSIQMQETAEMVGLLMEQEGKKGFMNNDPVIISQDHNELYVTFASFHEGYLRYLKDQDAPITENTYLKLQSYGPFCTYRKDRMKSFASLVIAMTLAAKAA
ncbi:hypothetical protein ANI_1_812114 [Paecilomyces variotii No. 5]|uniref:Uncharacterized protein n=1 Tax=Byssochlamys spectabilis (strain No. 5 / NBRC 109023) TaxID=1356009 RepID=V5G512_BYSSN|nr:hypothetical protein ANI_1_812114 [Paecilomyces variotii No. 5]